MTFEEFCKLCDQHDFAYQYTEDHKVYQQNATKHAVLVLLAVAGGKRFMDEFDRRAGFGKN